MRPTKKWYALLILAYADHFIRTLPGGYQMVLNEEAKQHLRGSKTAAHYC
jgi:ABC-type bacteriocin/lantibiotic exporter with double-glycine peptidase domain